MKNVNWGRFVLGAIIVAAICFISDGFLQDAPTVKELTHRHDLTPEKYGDFAMSWVEMGATIVGGCCEVGPAHIAHLAHRLRNEGHEIV